MNIFNKTDKTKIVFMGTPEFAVPALKKIIEDKKLEILAVITAPDKPVGRNQALTPPPIKLLANQHKIFVFQPEKIKEIEKNIKELAPDLIIVSAYGQIIPKNILDIPKYGCLNVHPSLLPKYRGASPIQFAILNGEKETGVTIMLVDEKMDHGPIIANCKFKIVNLNFTCKELSKKLAEIGAQLLVETIPKWINKKIKVQFQNDKEATYTKILKKEDGKINWQKSAQEIERQITAFHPWPGSFAVWQIQGKEKILKIKITKAAAHFDNHGYLTLGQVFLDKNKKISVSCPDGYLILEKIQLEGKKEMEANEFFKGHPEIIDSVLK